MIQRDLALSDFSTWKIGGKLSYYLLAKCQQDVIDGFCFAKENSLELMFLGNGSNVLFDEDFTGLLIRIDRDFVLNEVPDDLVGVSAGQMLSRATKIMKARSWTSMDPLATIPGNVGGSLVNNAGAFDLEISDFVHSVEGFDLYGKYLVLSKSEIDFAYRYCSLRGNFLVTQVNFFNFKKELCDQQFRQTRKNTQPLNYPSTGCVFKNPDGDSAGRLIDQSNCKKMHIGGAEVSDIHANFIINKDGADAQSIKDLIHKVQSTVKDRQNISLHRELQYSSELKVHLKLQEESCG
ncbi:MAG: UDP-N-acetylmuramate dehydrogenase [Candidatus Cloacimonetes bacterium]|nr:UDP-N-acetylmuramate dehydrogenase [Candidatus Cloacimonadota bacterium]